MLRVNPPVQEWHPSGGSAPGSALRRFLEASGDRMARDSDSASLPPEGYTVTIAPGSVTAQCADDRGARYALLTLEQLAAQETVPCGTIRDYPGFRVRGFQFLHCMNQWSAIGVDLKLMPPSRYEKFRAQIEAMRPGDEPPPEFYDVGRPYTRFDEDFALELAARMATLKMNTVLLCAGDSVRWESHPEIALRDAWPPERMRRFVRKLNALHLDVMPGFNFSPMHDEWLGKWHERVDSPEYIRMNADLIREFAALCPGARYFHLGMDEEDVNHHPHRGHLPSILRPTPAQLCHLDRLADVAIECGMEPVCYADILMDKKSKEWDWDALAPCQDLVERLRKKVVFMDWKTYCRPPADSGDNTAGVAELHRRGFKQITSSYFLGPPTGTPLAVARKLWDRPDMARSIGGIVETVWKPILRTRALETELTASVDMCGPAFWNARAAGEAGAAGNDMETPA